MVSYNKLNTNSYRLYKMSNLIYLLFSLLLITWYILPSVRLEFRYPPTAVVAFLLISWSFLTIKKNQYFIIKVLMLCGILAVIYLLVPYPLNLKKALNIFQIQVIYFTPMFIFQYFVSKKDIRAIKIIFVVLSIMFLFVLFKTIGQLQIDPSVARALASGSEDEELLILRRFNIGGYGFSYAIGILVPFLFNFYLRTKYKIIKIVLLAIFLLCFDYLIKAQYAIIFLIVLIICLFSLMYKIKNVPLKMFIMIFLILPIPFLSDIFFLMARNITGTSLSIRLLDVAEFLAGGQMTGDFYVRNSMYLNGISLFLKSPIWGTAAIEQSPYYIDFISSHSTIIGMACETGIIGIGIYLYTYYSSKRFFYKEFEKVGGNNSFFLIPFLTLFILMFLNPTFETMELSVMLFLYIPSIIYLYSNWESKQKMKGKINL